MNEINELLIKNEHNYTTNLRYFIKPVEDYNIYKLPDRSYFKYVENTYFDPDTSDLDIDLTILKSLEVSYKRQKKTETLLKIKQYYKQCIWRISKEYSYGWNRWSENILDLFLADELHKVLWGSGNCGKSAVMGLLLYIKWRINPSERMVVIASKVVKDASSRVWAYIKSIHNKAPGSGDKKFFLTDTNTDRAIYCLVYNEEQKDWMRDVRASITALPIKVDLKNDDMGSNLLGKHPKDWLLVCFDEAQELPGKLLDKKIFLNWYTNDNLNIYAWGNPQHIDYYNEENHDLLFRLGTKQASENTVKKWKDEAHKTFVKVFESTRLLHLSMLDSPKDDPEEKDCYLSIDGGPAALRLHFLAGKSNANRIKKEGTDEDSSSWYSQVLGFPYVDYNSTESQTILSPFMVLESRNYPLIWRDESETSYIMALDPAVTGKSDPAAVVVGKIGVMQDGRVGIDFMDGRYFRKFTAADAPYNFVDYVWDEVYKLSQTLNIPINRIAAEFHASSSVAKYALAKHIEDGKWAHDVSMGKNVVEIEPTGEPSERALFRVINKMVTAKDMCVNKVTEMCCAVRCGVLSKQIFNIPEKVLQQFYARKLELKDNATSKFKVEGKEAMRIRGYKSPNEADCITYAVELARRAGMFSYRFIEGSAYKNIYGEQYYFEKTRHITQQNMKVVSNALGLNTVFNPENSRKKHTITNI